MTKPAGGPDTAGGPFAPDLLVARVQAALDAFDGDGPRDPAAAAATLVRTTRETLAALAATAPGTEAGGRDEAPELLDRHRTCRSLIHRVLERAADRAVRLALAASPFATEWVDLQIEAVVASDYTVGELFFSRVRAMGDRTLFLLPPSSPEARVSWASAGDRVGRIARALVALRERREIGGSVGPVAMLGENSADLALFDLACLSTGVPNVPLPTHSPPDQIAWILQHAGARALFLGNDLLADSAADAIAAAGPSLHVHWLVPDRDARGPVRPLEEFLAKGTPVSLERVREEVARVRSGDLATTMYTSGTTGNPKGVPFTQANLVTKRFARAAAWPDLGEGDVFLCYLPLFHTFGRWLEMLGCVFWKAVYAFVDDVSVESLLYSFQRARPTTFISVPKKWLQIAEAAAAEAGPGPNGAPDEKALAAALVRVTGGRLKRGLSAAGYLPPEVFRDFHAAGIELHSGFGMTEATGGITMTPAGSYRDDSIGVALPGIELKVADDGELLIRGPYVTPEAPGDPPREGGWFATGDIVTVDRSGQLAIIDRKKEIFKNIQGETIAPRRIESLFADFEIIERVILIGDGRPFCTVLIVPSAEFREGAGESGSLTLDSSGLHELFAPTVSTVNRFLAPFERILDFALLARDLDADLGELTAKGTPRRRTVNEHFAEVIESLYSREAVKLEVDGIPVRVPHWFLRQVGIPSTQARVAAGAVELGGPARRLPIRRAAAGPGIVVGDLEYVTGGDVVPLGEILGRAELWLGNGAVREFAGPGIEHWWRRGRKFETRIRIASRRPVADGPATAAPSAFASGEGAAPGDDAAIDVPLLHELARALSHPDGDLRRAAVERLRESLTGENPELERLARELLRSGLEDPAIRAWCLGALISGITPEELAEILERGFADPGFLDDSEIRIVGGTPLRNDQLEHLLHRVRENARDGGGPGSAHSRLLTFLVAQAVRHRTARLRLRSLIATLLAEDHPAGFHAEVETLLDELTFGFRARLPPVHLAAGVTIEEAVELKGDIEEGHVRRIRDALGNTPLLPEAMALLGAAAPRAPLTLGRSSVRVTFLGTGRGRTVYLLEWSPGGFADRQPRFECVMKVNRELPWEKIEEERRLLVRTRRGGTGRAVVKTQGGGYPDQEIWTEEFIPGHTLDVLMEDLAREAESGEGRLPDLWQFLVASSAGLLVDFWNRTGRTLAIAEPSPQKVVLPGHDWQIGGRLVSIANRVECESLTDVLVSVHRGIIRPLRERFPVDQVVPTWPLLFSGAIEVLGVGDGLDRLEAEAPWRTHPTGIGPAALRFVSSSRRRGFLPIMIRLAARRYRRWSQLNPEATLEARAVTLDQIAAAYGLGEVDVERPRSRLQLYRHTVFRGARRELARAFDMLIAGAQARTAEGLPTPAARDRGGWHDELARLREDFELSDHEEFFLARILYPHVDPSDEPILVREEGAAGAFATGIEVRHVDTRGESYRIHSPRNPSEVGALSRIFHAAQFRRVPEPGRDELLVITNERRRVCGGLIFRRPSPTYAHLEWLVLSRHLRGRGLGKALLREFLGRLKAQGVGVVSTGFFRPGFFARFGFGVDPRYAGLVKMLLADEAEAPERRDAPPTDGEPPGR